MNKQLKIKQLELEIAKLKAKSPIKAKISPVAKCKAWVKKQRKGDFVKSENGVYTNKAGEQQPIKVLTFSNNETYNVTSKGRFWKVR